MGGEFTYQPKWDPKTVLTTTAKCEGTFESEGRGGGGSLWNKNPNQNRKRLVATVVGDRGKDVAFRHGCLFWRVPLFLDMFGGFKGTLKGKPPSLRKRTHPFFGDALLLTFVSEKGANRTSTERKGTAEQGDERPQETKTKLGSDKSAAPIKSNDGNWKNSLFPLNGAF